MPRGDGRYNELRDDKRDRRKKSRSGNSKRGDRLKRDRMLAVAGFEDEKRQPSRKKDYSEMSSAQLQESRDQEYARQEEALDHIYTGVIGLKNHGNAINSEVVAQNAMLDDLGNAIDITQEELEAQTEKARKINGKKAKVCKLYCCIIVLFIALVTLLAY